jgi:hypothetical protein
MLGVAGLGSRNMMPTPARAEQTFATGLASKEELVAKLLDALERQDLEALHRLRITESEYKGIILPGQVPVGQEFRRYRSEVSDFAWQTLNTKSVYYERYLLSLHGGRRYELKDVRFEQGTEEYAGYSAHKQLRLSLTHEGSPATLATGSIVEVGGRYKFASFIRD